MEVEAVLSKARRRLVKTAVGVAAAAALIGLHLIGVLGRRSHLPRTHAPSPPTDDIRRGNTPMTSADSRSHAGAQAWVDENVRRANYVLNSRRLYNEVQVPLIMGSDGRPYVQVSWGGRKIVCILDTGTPEVLWPRWMGLKGQPLSVIVRTSDVLGKSSSGEWVLAPDITLGGFSVHDLVTLAEDEPARSQGTRHSLSMPVVGLQAFDGVILTIDYAHKRLTLRNREYFLNITRKPRSPHSLLAEYPSYDNNQVVLPGTLSGHKARFVLDTGCAYDMIIGASYAHKYLSVGPIWTDPRSGTIWYGSRHLAGTLLGRPFTGAGYVVPTTSPVDALLGTGLFRLYRVSIDQYRGIVLFERN